MKKDLVSWEIEIGNNLWLVLSKEKPIVKKSKVRGLKFDNIIIDESVEFNEELLNKITPLKKPK